MQNFALPAGRSGALVLLLALPLAAANAQGVVARRNWFDTPFAAATEGMPACPRPEGPLMTEDEMRSAAHARIERGTSCWLAGQCEDSNAYRRDPEIQQRVLAAIGAERAFARSSVWVTTERRWVTLQGCLESGALRARLIDRVRRVEGVELVFDQLMVGTAGRSRWIVDPAWRPATEPGKKKPTR